MTPEEQIEKLWESLAKVEITAIKAASTSAEAKAKLRTYEMKLYSLIDENQDMRDLIRKLMPDE